MTWRDQLPQTRQALGLALISAATAALVSWTAGATAPLIEAAKRNDLLSMLGQVIEADLHDNDLLQDSRVLTDAGTSTRYYIATRSEPPSITAIAFEAVSSGYSGPISLLVSVDPNGVVLGVRVTAHTETPGLGDRIEITKSDWALQFDGTSLRDPQPSKWAVTKDGGRFDALTGATITPRAVVRGVFEGLTRFEAHRASLLGSTEEPPPTPIRPAPNSSRESR